MGFRTLGFLSAGVRLKNGHKGLRISVVVLAGSARTWQNTYRLPQSGEATRTQSRFNKGALVVAPGGHEPFWFLSPMHRLEVCNYLEQKMHELTYYSRFFELFARQTNLQASTRLALTRPTTSKTGSGLYKAYEISIDP